MLSCSYLLNNKLNANILNNKLNITYLNICGLKSKLLNSDICYMIKKYDILIFVDTKTDKFDEINLPGGYSGIIIIYKDTISKCLTFPTSNSEFVQWVEIANESSHFTKLLIGCVLPHQKTENIRQIVHLAKLKMN